MLKSNIRETGSSGQPATGMTIREVMEQCKMLYFAGTATPSTLLTWTMVLLRMHPESGRIVQGRRPLAYLERSIHAKITILLCNHKYCPYQSIYGAGYYDSL
jgi:cytochrome P450